MAVADPAAGPVKTGMGSKATGVLGEAVFPSPPSEQLLPDGLINVSSAELPPAEAEGVTQGADSALASCSQVTARRFPRRPQISPCMSGGSPPTRASEVTLVEVPQVELAKPLSRSPAVTTERTL